MSIETVDTVERGVVMDPLIRRQKEDVAKMRTSLLSCIDENGVSTMRAIQTVTVLRVYHQLNRIIKYTELMDKLEEALYTSIDNYIDNADFRNVEVLDKLLSIQSQLQKSMIESHKLLQPYMDIRDFSVVDLVDTTVSNSGDSSITAKLMTSESRDKVRNSAQAVIDALMLEESNE